MSNLMDLSFLQDVEVEAVKKTVAAPRIAVVKLPENADLRVFSNGAIYPSKAFAEKAGLEFVPRTIIPATADKKEDYIIHGNALDIFSSLKWGAVMGKLPQEVIFMAVVKKSDPKVDVWGSTKYDGAEPKSSVFNQGATVFTKDVLLPMLSEVYGVDWETTQHVDLVVVEGQPMRSANNVYHLPKRKIQKDAKGEKIYVDDYSRRDNIDIFPLIISHTETKEAKEPAGTKENALFNTTAADNSPELEGEETEPATDWTQQLGS